MPYNPKIKKYLETLKNISHTTGDLLFVWDLSTDATWIFGEDSDIKFDIACNSYEPIEISKFLSIIHPNDKREVLTELGKVKSGERKENNFNCRWIDSKGKAIWLNCRGRIVNDDDGNPLMLVGSASFEALENKINEITGIYNRRVMFADVIKNKFLSKRGNFLFLGLDRLAKAYSEHSREYVESLIEYCGNLLETYASEEIRVYHVEDDVFMLYTTQSGEEYAHELFDEIAGKLQEKVTVTGVAFSGGKMSFDEKEMYKTAIAELADAKTVSRSTLTFLTKEDIDEKYEEVSLTEEIVTNIANDFNGFYAVYQPQIQHGSFEIIGVEALMRYKSPQTGVQYPPVVFIPLIEEAGLMKEASLWILKEALAQVKKWRESLPNLTLNVNYTLKSLKDSLDETIKIFKASGLPSKSLLIEITETVSVDEVDNVSILIRACKEAGIGISIDDFGTGYSNLALLKEIKCDEIKIERTFVSGITEGSYGYLLINSLISFSRENGIQVCCEGTETEQDVLTLARLKPDLYQGYVFDRPCTAEQFENGYINQNSKDYHERKAFCSVLREKEREQISNFDPKEILSNVNVGLNVFYCDFDKEVFEMHPDKVTEKLLGMSDNLSPVERNDFWFSRIKEGYSDFVRKSLDALKTSEKVVQFAYPWIHPEHGEILISMSGARSFKEGSKLIVKSLFRVISDIERLSETNAKNTMVNHIKNKYMGAVLGNAIAFMDINLSQNSVQDGLQDLSGNQPPSEVYGKSVYSSSGVMIYDEFEKWWANGYLLSDKDKFLKENNCKYLIDAYANGQDRVEVNCHCKDVNGNEYDCRKIFYIGKDEVMGDITALCVIYDDTENLKEKLKQKNKDNVIRSICDEFKSVIHANLDKNTFEFYREHVSLSNWREGVTTYEQMISTFGDLFVVEKDIVNYKFMLSSNEIKRRLQNQNSFKFEYERKCPDGIRCHEVKVKRDLDHTEEFYVIIGVKDVENDVRLKRDLKNALNMAYTDILTGLNNQQGLMVKCVEALKDKNMQGVFMFMDLDNFKSVNDMYGHGMGDKILFEVGKILKEETRGKDIVGRYGGDEFVALIYEEDTKKSQDTINRIRDRISKICYEIGLEVGVTASIGLSFTCDTGYDYRRLKEIADDRLYLAKKSGKDKIVIKS